MAQLLLNEGSPVDGVGPRPSLKGLRAQHEGRMSCIEMAQLSGNKDLATWPTWPTHLYHFRSFFGACN